MEQARYWMWTKRKHGMNSHAQALTNPSSYNDSWEEQAFAEDAAGPLGGCIWPPRSYSCSFCRREFRSAQALGGHMNVHRRDRARLKQSTSPHNEILHHHHHQSNRNHIQNPCVSLGVVQCPSQVRTLVYNPNPNSDFNVLASPSSPSRVSAPQTHENSGELTLVDPPIVHGYHKRSTFSSPPSWSNLVAGRYFCEGEKNSRILESGCRPNGDYVKPDLSVSLNLVSCKRRRITDASPLPFFLLKPSSVDKHHVESEVLELSPNSLEDLDLELRLGDPPKVK
ncbi:hypothetical protein L1049_008893 [Liquidambar formosana]|uniref:C2H2-type domain-containing protein n=1 Tax=Liquidambar formosana TaxID=63359 RepID=A0AAP0SBF1_LIQFO